jgi:uncharacterized protein YdhG (YjbR/CyaY superfamily)
MKKTIDAYINSHTKEEKVVLEELRQIIHSVSDFEEDIVYGMPAFRYKGKVVAGFRIYSRHTGFYPYSGNILGKFSAKLKEFKTSIGAVQFPRGKSLPRTLVREIIRARMKEIDSQNKKV